MTRRGAVQPSARSIFGIACDHTGIGRGKAGLSSHASRGGRGMAPAQSASTIAAIAASGFAQAQEGYLLAALAAPLSDSRHNSGNYRCADGTACDA